MINPKSILETKLILATDSLKVPALPVTKVRTRVTMVLSSPATTIVITNSMINFDTFFMFS